MRKRWALVSSEYLLKLDPFYNRRINDCEEFVPSESVFFNRLYIKPSEKNGSQAMAAEIQNHISVRDKNLVICIKGYAGCGKSVFIQKILHDLFPRNDNFANNTYSLKPAGNIHRLEIGAGTSLNDIESRYVDDLSNSMAETIRNDKNQHVFRAFSQIVVDNDDALNYIDNAHLIPDQFIRSIGTNLQGKKEELRVAIRAELKQFKVPILFAIDCLWRIAQNKTYIDSGEKEMGNALFFICFDNLDAIDDIEMCRGFIKNLCEFKINLDECLYNLNKNHREYYIHTFTFFVTCRNVTWGRMHLSEFAEDDSASDDNPHLLDYDISAFYEYVDIVTERIKYFTGLGKRNKQAQKILAEMEMTRQLNDMRYIRDRFKPLFNYNYRKCIEVINYIIRNAYNYVEESIQLASHSADFEDDGIYSGSSSVFFRMVFDYFKDKQLFAESALSLTDLHSDYQECSSNLMLTSPARIMLQYLYNKNRTGNLEHTKLNIIFDYFSDIYTPSDICNILYKLFVRNPAWRRPINFSNRPLKEHHEKDDLEMQRQSYESNIIHNPSDFTQFEICSAGEEFIEFVVAHYEYFSCRISTDNHYYPPLYTADSFMYYRNENKYEFEITSDAVLQAVEKCCIKLNQFNKEFMQKKKLELPDYLSEPIIKVTRRNGNPQLHEERIIFSHIFHLEAYRYYLINTHLASKSVEERADINKRLVSIISRYISLYNKYIMSQQRKGIANELSTKISNIQRSKYTDFTTRISV